MKFSIYSTFLALALVLAAGCVKENTNLRHDSSAGIRLKIDTPGSALTRAVQEEEIAEVNVLVFENTDGTELTYRYTVRAYSLGPGSDSDYEFLTRIVPSENPMRLYVMANAGSAINGVTPGQTVEQVRETVVTSFTAAGFTTVLPMSGAIDLPDGLDENIDTLETVVLRAVARVDVFNAASADFTLTSVKVYRANDQIQLIPDNVVNNLVPAPSVPSASLQTINTVTYPVTGASLVGQIYIPESVIPDPADFRTDATAVVVGGRYGTETATTYYRMDFIPEDETLAGQVLRNHRYIFTIAGVLAPGWSTDDEASLYPSTNIEVNVEVWNDMTLDMVFDDYDYLGVTTRTVRLNYFTGAAETVGVDTSLDSYVAYWGAADGTIDQEAGPIVFGADRDDPDELFNAAISSTGNEVVFTALDSYDEATAEPKYLVLVAGRLRIVITVTQGQPVFRSGGLNVFGSIRQIGNLGNFTLGSSIVIPGDRARGLGFMLSSTLNFGHTAQAKVDIDGIYIAGAMDSQTRMPRSAYESYDVLYLTYDNDPIQADVDSIMSWMAQSKNRVLIVQTDGISNENMLATLGLSKIAESTTTPYTFALTEAPDFITNGPFGAITTAFSYRCVDGTHSGITPADAAQHGYTPILYNPSGNVALAVNIEDRIIISGDCDLYNNSTGGTGFYLNNTNAAPQVDTANPAEVLMANLWAWIVSVAMTETE